MSDFGNEAVKDNLSDFDNSDDDLADLLNDDDDDIYAKKLSISSPYKKSPDKSKIVSPKKLQDKPGSSTAAYFSPEKKNLADFNTTLKESPKHKESKQSFDNFEGDALSEFLRETTSKPKTSSPLRKSSDHGESKYLDDLGFTKLSSKSTSSKNDDNISSKVEQDDFNSDDEELLKSLDSDLEDKSLPNSPRKRSGSYFDDFLNTLSPKHSTKKQSDRSEGSIKDSSNKNLNDDDGLHSQSTKSISSAAISQKRRDSVLKQVSFKELPEQSTKTVESPIKEKPFIESQANKQAISLKDTKTAQPKTKRSEKMAASKDNDMDWSTFFKESPKKNKIVDKVPAKKIDMPPNNKSMNRRKSSSAEWLGINELSNTSNLSSSMMDNDMNFKEKDETTGSSADWLETEEASSSMRPVSSKESVSRPRRPRVAPSISSDWLDDDFESNSKDKNKSIHSPQVQKSSINIPDNQSKKVISHSEKSFGGEKFDPKSNVINDAPSIKLSPKKDLMTKQVTSSDEISLQDPEKYLSSEIVSNNQPIFPQTYATSLPQSKTILNDTEKVAALMNNYILDRDQLLKSSEAMKSMYEERINAIEVLHKNQIKALEESFKILENNLKKEADSKVQDCEKKLSTIEKEKEASEYSLKNKLSELEKDHSKEVQKLKDLHNLSISQMKQDHEEAVKRLKRLKDQEVEAVLSTQVHSRSLQNLADQLEARTSELAKLQSKVEERNQSTVCERQALLERKERELKVLQNRLQKQLEDGDEERIRLQQLVLRLENRLQKSTTEGEEDRWEVQQMKARLKVQQRFLDEEYKLKTEQIEREKEKLQISQNSLLQEQKIVLLQLAQERQQLSQEKNDIDLVARRIKEEETKFNVKKMKEESFIERQKQFIQQEENRIISNKNNLKIELQQMEKERDLLERDKQQFMSEKERFNEYSLKIRRKADEIELVALSTAEDKEKARLEQSAANKIRNEHHLKLQHITQQMQNLMEKEHQILQEKEKLAEEKNELERTKNSMLCVKCKLSSQLPLHMPTANMSANQLMAYPVVNGFPSQMPQTFIDPNLVVWQISAQKDHAFLEEELSYLRSLKEPNKKRDKT